MNAEALALDLKNRTETADSNIVVIFILDKAFNRLELDSIRIRQRNAANGTVDGACRNQVLERSFIGRLYQLILCNRASRTGLLVNIDMHSTACLERKRPAHVELTERFRVYIADAHRAFKSNLRAGSERQIADLLSCITLFNNDVRLAASRHVSVGQHGPCTELEQKIGECDLAVDRLIRTAELELVSDAASRQGKRCFRANIERVIERPGRIARENGRAGARHLNLGIAERSRRLIHAVDIESPVNGSSRENVRGVCGVLQFDKRTCRNIDFAARRPVGRCNLIIKDCRSLFGPNAVEHERIVLAKHDIGFARCIFMTERKTVATRYGNRA